MAWGEGPNDMCVAELVGGPRCGECVELGYFPDSLARQGFSGDTTHVYEADPRSERVVPTPGGTVEVHRLYRHIGAVPYKGVVS